MKKLRRFKDVLNSDRELKESSIVGKGVAFAQNRIHAAAKTKYISSLNQIQNDCRQGIREDDARKRSDIQFQVLLDLAGTLKLLADMSTANNNIGATAVLDAENIEKRLTTLIPKC
jgi:flagellar hook assembly protein FlgD